MIKNTLSIKTRYNKVFIIILLISQLSVMLLSIRNGYTNINENLFKKSALIQSYNYLRYILGNKFFSNGILVGKDKWLLFAYDKNLDDYQNSISFSDQQLNLIEKRVALVDRYGKENNIHFLIVIAPNKETIYPEKVPDAIQVIGNESRFDQVLRINQFSNVQILDVRTALQNARFTQDTYYRTDTHWNNFGAYSVYAEITKELAQKYPELRSYPQDLLIPMHTTKVFDLSESANLQFIAESAIMLKPRANSFERIQTSDTYGYHETTRNSTINTPSILVYHDSFGSAGLNSYLSLSFETAHFIRYEEDNHFPPNAIESFQPNIVILEIVERHVHFLKDILPVIISQ